MKYLIFLLLMLLYSCQSNSLVSNEKDSKEVLLESKRDTIIKKLVEDAYGNFFNYMVHDQIIETVWEEAGGADRLKEILVDEKAPMKARFLVSEVLFKKKFGFVVDVGANVVAEIYADAMANNRTGMANSWGLLYEHNDEGPVGVNWLLFGEAAIPELVKLLDDETIHMYNGSKVATMGNAYQFRVKDFAAYYICRIKHTNAVYHKMHAVRDKEIETLKILLLKEQK